MKLQLLRISYVHIHTYVNCHDAVHWTATMCCGVQDSAADSDEKCRATLMLCYGYVTLYAPPELAVSRLEANILNVVVPQLASVKVCHIVSLQGRSNRPGMSGS